MNHVFFHFLFLLGVASSPSSSSSSSSTSDDAVDPGWYDSQKRSPSDTSKAMTAFQSGLNAHGTDSHTAQRSFRLVTSLTPEVADGWTNLGVSLESTGNFVEALNIYQKAASVTSCKLCLKKASKAECNLLLRLFEEHGVTQYAERCVLVCQAALQYAPGLQANMEVATALSQVFRYEEAYPYYALAVEGNGNVFARLNYANSLLRGGHPKNALSNAYLALSIENTSSVHEMLSTVYATSQISSAKSISHSYLALHLLAKEWADKGKSMQLSLYPLKGVINKKGVFFEEEVKMEDVEHSLVRAICTREAEKEVYVVRFERRFVSDVGIVYDKRVVVLGDHMHSARPERVFELSAQKAKIIIHRVKVASLLQAKSNNHYHALIETLSRLVAFSVSRIFENEDIALLLPENPLLNEAVLRILAPLSEMTKQPLLRNLKILFQGKDRYRHKYDVVHTVFSADSGSDPWSVYFPSFSMIRGLSDALGRGLVGVPRSSRKGHIVFASRVGDAARGMLLGEETALVMGLRAGLDMDVVLHRGAGMPLVSQLQMFRDARAVVGPHGAGLANIIACRPGTPLIVLPMSPPVDRVWHHLAEALRMKFFSVPSITAFYYTGYTVNASGVQEVVDIVREAVHTSVWI